jgi:hypothetical protein
MEYIVGGTRKLEPRKREVRITFFRETSMEEAILEI